MAGWKPIGSIYDTIRKRWFGPGDVFHKGDWLPRLYAREFEHTDEEPNVPEQGSIPTPPPPSSGGQDPRVDQLLRDVAELKAAPPGSGQDPRVEGLLDRVATVEGKATRNAEGLVSARQVASEAKAVADGLASGVEQAAAKAQAATEAASAATAKATQVVDAANQAKRKAEDAVAKAGQAEAAAAQAGNKAEAASMNAMSASQSVQGLQGKVQAAEAAAGRAEAKAGEAESTATAAQAAATSAASTASAAKVVTDKLAPLGLDETYQETRANARLAKEAADNAQIIAQGVGGKVEALTSRVQSAEASLSEWDTFSTNKLDNWADILNQVTNRGLKIHAAQPISMSSGGVVSVLGQSDLVGSHTLSNRSTRDATILIAGPDGAATSTTETLVIKPGKACLVSGDGNAAVIHYPGQASNSSMWVLNRTFSGNLRLFSGELELSSLIVKGKDLGI